MAFKLNKKWYSSEEYGLPDKNEGFTAGIANICPQTGHLFANQERMIDALDIFSAEGVNLALFPEYGLSGAFWDDRERCAAHMADATLDRILPWLEEKVRPYINDTLKYVVVNGPVPDGSGKFYNTTLVMDSSGASLSHDQTYKKKFLPGAEKEHIVSGLDDFLVLDTQWGRMGFLTCYDICFPQPLTDLVYNRGIDILVVPAAWRRQGVRAYSGMGIHDSEFYHRQWEILLPALATQYQIWILAANGIGPHAKPNTAYCGRSGIWSPSGINLILGSDQEEELLILKNIDIQTALKVERADFGCVEDYQKVQQALEEKSS